MIISISETSILAFGAFYIPLIVMLIIGALLVGAMVFMSWLLGPGRQGPIKGIAYESGIDPVTSPRKPFHARFYLVAILFLVFDVELIFFYPWAVMFYEARVTGESVHPTGYYLLAIAVFTIILVAAFIYEWARGVLDWK